MNCKGKFVFKGIEEREGGEFVNSSGKKIAYDSKYVLKLDERTEDGKIYDRKFAIDKKETALVNELKKYDFYDEINLQFDVRIFGTQVRLVPTAIIDDPLDDFED